MMRPELKMFSQYMEHKLKLNDHKGGWENLDADELFTRLRAEVDELEQAIKSEPELNIMLEAADVANFAMMIAWNAARGAFILGENKKHGYYAPEVNINIERPEFHGLPSYRLGKKDV